MELKKVTVRTKCDNGACRNYAEYEVYRADTMPSGRLRLCRDCLSAVKKLCLELERDERKLNKLKKETCNVGANLGSGAK